MFQKFIQDCFTDVDNKLNFFDVCIKKVNNMNIRIYLVFININSLEQISSGEGKDPLIEYFQIQ